MNIAMRDIRDGMRMLVLCCAMIAAGTLAGLLVGWIIGAGTVLVQPHVREPWSVLVNSASPWLLGGFAAGTVPTGRCAAMASGLIALMSEVAAYFVTAAVGAIPVSHSYVVFWTACALAGGPLCGWAGWAWRRGARRARAVGAAFPPGTFIAEAFGAYGLRLHYQPAIAMFLVIGIAMFILAGGPVLTLRLAPGPGIVAWTVFFAIAGMLVFGPVLNAFVGINSGGVTYPPPAAPARVTPHAVAVPGALPMRTGLVRMGA